MIATFTSSLLLLSCLRRLDKKEEEEKEEEEEEEEGEGLLSLLIPRNGLECRTKKSRVLL